MASEGSILTQVDSQLDQFLSSWDIYSTTLALLLVTFLVYPLFFSKDPDTHPLLLARQASASQVRQPGESATYRSLEVPHGHPLRSGLNVKDAGAPKWAAGKDGDLRDVWKQALKGVGGKNEDTLRVVSVLGNEVKEWKPKDLMLEINLLGEFLKRNGSRRVAIHLPNTVEFIVAFFACVFYGLTPVLIPQGIDQAKLANILMEVKADVLLAPAGIHSSEELLQYSPCVKRIIWIVEKTSRQMDWMQGPQSPGGSVQVDLWHDVVDPTGQAVTSDPPAEVTGFKVPSIISLCPKHGGVDFSVMEYSQLNIVAAVAAQISALPRLNKLEHSDLVLSLDSLTSIFPLTVTLAALFSNASIALTSVAGTGADYASAFQSVSPTVIVATDETMATAEKKWTKPSAINIVQRVDRTTAKSALLAGRMPKASRGSGPRLIYISSSTESGSCLDAATLEEVRLMTHARIIHALTSPEVAGAVAQTNMLDYRIDKSHFGPPLSCVELKLVDAPGHKISDDGDVKGEILVSGPAVVSGERKLGVIGHIRDDATLTVVS